MRRALIAGLVALAPVAMADDKLEPVMEAGAEHALWLAAAEAMVAEYGLAMPAGEGPSAFGTLMMIQDDDAVSIERLLDVALIWLAAADRADPAPQLIARAGLDRQRALRLICYVAGAGPGKAHSMIGFHGLPGKGAETCEADYMASLDGWEAALAPYAGTEAATADVTVTHEPGPWRDWLIGTEILEIVAETLAADYALPPGLAIRAGPCGSADAFWDDEARAIRLCHELLDQFHDLARRAKTQ